MTKMASMKKSAADRAAEKRAMGETASGLLQNSEDREGPAVHLEHHHLKNMGLTDLKSGDKVHMEGEGHVEHSESRKETDGDHMRATVRFHKMGAELKSPRGDVDERGALKNDIEKAHAQSEKGRDEGVERRGLKGAESGKKIAGKK